MHRFFTQSKNISEGKILINQPGQLHHIRSVLWLKKGDRITLFDEKENEYEGQIEQVSAKEASVKVLKKYLAKGGGKKILLAVACALPKKAKIDEIIDKLTQLGADIIIPMDTERAVVKLDERKTQARLERWEKIALSASQQSKRSSLPQIKPLTNFKDALFAAKPFDLKLIPTLEGERVSLREAIDKARPRSIFILIGPEGDFSPGEIALAKKNAFLPVTLGKLTLRVDTAAVAAASFIRLYENY